MKHLVLIVVFLALTPVFTAEPARLETVLAELHNDDASRREAALDELLRLVPKSEHPSLAVARPSNGKPFAWDLVYDGLLAVTWATFSDANISKAVDLILLGPVDPRRNHWADAVLPTLKDREGLLVLGIRLVEQLRLDSRIGAEWLKWAWTLNQHEDDLFRITAAYYSDQSDLVATALGRLIDGRLQASPANIGLASSPNIPRVTRFGLLEKALNMTSSPLFAACLLNAGPGHYSGTCDDAFFVSSADALLKKFTPGRSERALALLFTTGPDDTVRNWTTTHLSELLALPISDRSGREGYPLLSDPLIVAALFGLEPTLAQLVDMPGAPWMGMALGNQAWWFLARRATSDDSENIIAALPEANRAEVSAWLNRSTQPPKPALDAPTPAWVSSQIGQDPNVDVTILVDHPKLNGASGILIKALQTENKHTRLALVERLLSRPDSFAFLNQDPRVAGTMDALTKDVELPPELRARLERAIGSHSDLDTLVTALADLQPGPNLDGVLVEIACTNIGHPCLEPYREISGPPRQQWIAWTLRIAAGETDPRPSFVNADLLNWSDLEQLLTIWKAHPKAFASQLAQLQSLQICSNLESRRTIRLLGTWLTTLQVLYLAK